MPRNRTTPLLGFPRPTVRPVSVDLPDPFAPISATHSPSFTARVTSSTARWPSNSTLTPSQDSTGGAGAAAAGRTPGRCPSGDAGPVARSAAAAARAAANQVSFTASAASGTDSGSLEPNGWGTACASRIMSGMPTPVASHGPRSAQAMRGGWSRTTRPSSISTTRSAQGATSSTRCSMMITPVLPCRASRCSVASTSWAPTGSRSDNGSSSTRILGRMARVAAMAVRCFWPPDSVTTEALRIPAMPVTSRHSSTLAAISGCGSARFSGPNATSACTVWVISCRFGFWNTMPTSCDASCGFIPDREVPPNVTRPLSSPCTRDGISPHNVSASVDLPQPEAPVISTTSPGAMPRFTCRSAARTAPT